MKRGIAQEANMFWQQYKKTLLVTQVFILLVCVVLCVLAGLTFVGVLPYLLSMEVFSLIGTAWGLRLKRKVNAKLGRLPLEH
jgi:hypothetical protein